MYADRLHRRIDPIGVGASALVAGGMISALIFAVPQIVPIVTFTPLPVQSLPQPLPSPVPEKPKPQPKHMPEQNPLVTKPLTVPDPKPPQNIDLGPVDPVPLKPLDPPGTGTETVAKPLDPPPVYVDAAPDPRFAGDFQPPYPSSMLRSGTEARISVRVLIGTDGRVKQVDPVGSGDIAFFDATRRHALAHWRFKAATRGGVAVESWRTMTVRFQLIE